MINSFKDDYAFLSNFYSCEINYQGLVYPSVEHAFQAAKTFDEDEKFKILSANTPSAAKHLGKKVKLRRDWEQVKDNIMYSLLQTKFSNPELKEKLLTTGDEELVEGNYWHDNYWGSCYCKRCENKESKNMLGKLLMKIREELKGN